MNTKLLRLARKDNKGIRYWSVPGHGNPVRLVPSTRTPTGWGTAIYWPGADDKGHYMRGVDLDRHRPVARNEIRALIQACRKKS